VDLVVDQVVQLEHVHDTHGDLAVEGIAGPAVIEGDPASVGDAGHLEHAVDLLLGGGVEHGHRHGEALLLDLCRQVEQFLPGCLLQDPADLLGAVKLLEQALEILVGIGLLDHGVDVLADAVHGPAEVGLEDLAHVHARRHAQRVEHDVHGPSVVEERHVLLGKDARDDALVAVASRHLVAHGELALDGDIDLHHLVHAGRQVVAGGELLDLCVVEVQDDFLLVVDPADDLLDLALHLVAVGHADVLEVIYPELVEHVLGDEVTLLGDDGIPQVRQHGAGEFPAHEQVFQPRPGTVGQYGHLVVLVLAELLDLALLDLQGELVLLLAATVEDPGVDDGALDAGRDPQGRVLHLAGLFAEDGAQELFLGGELGLALGRDLAHEDVAGLDLGADSDDARIVEVLERFLAGVGDVPGDLLAAELHVAGHDLELLDVHRGVEVFLDHALADEDGVFIVVAAPRHEGDHEVPAQSQLALARGRAVGDDLVLAHVLPLAHDGFLVEGGVLVCPLELGEAVNVDAGVLGVFAYGVGLDDNALAVHVLHRAGAVRHDAHARVPGHELLDAGSHDGRDGEEQRHGLALHVGAHERPVGVVVLQERDEVGGHREELVGGHVHEGDLFFRHGGILTVAHADPDHVGLDPAVLIERLGGLDDDLLVLLDGAHVAYLVGDHAVGDHVVGGLDEAELVDAAVGG